MSDLKPFEKHDFGSETVRRSALQFGQAMVDHLVKEQGMDRKEAERHVAQTMFETFREPPDQNI